MSYPSVSEADRAWIESIRRNHDPQAAMLGAHFTLVFPAEASAADVAAEIGVIAAATKAIPFILRNAKAVRDVFTRGGHVFLVAEQGAADIGSLHDRLYRGVLRPHLRNDIPFEPHITVAASEDFDWCESVAAGLSHAPRAVVGRIESLELLEVGERTVSSIHRFILNAA